MGTYFNLRHHRRTNTVGNGISQGFFCLEHFWYAMDTSVIFAADNKNAACCVGKGYQGLLFKYAWIFRWCKVNRKKSDLDGFVKTKWPKLLTLAD